MADNYVVAGSAAYYVPPVGSAVLLYAGAPFPADSQNLDQVLEDGLVVKAPSGFEPGGQASDLVGGPVVPEADDVDGDGPIPPKSASKADWVDYAVSKGATKDEAEASSKDDLIAAYGSA